MSLGEYKDDVHVYCEEVCVNFEKAELDFTVENFTPVVEVDIVFIFGVMEYKGYQNYC